MVERFLIFRGDRRRAAHFWFEVCCGYCAGLLLIGLHLLERAQVSAIMGGIGLLLLGAVFFGQRRSHFVREAWIKDDELAILTPGRRFVFALREIRISGSVGVEPEIEEVPRFEVEIRATGQRHVFWGLDQEAAERLEGILPLPYG